MSDPFEAALAAVGLALAQAVFPLPQESLAGLLHRAADAVETLPGWAVPFALGTIYGVTGLLVIQVTAWHVRQRRRRTRP